MEFSVRVVYYDSDDEECLLENATVMVFLNESILSTGSLEETTGEDGVAHFECDWDTFVHDVIHGNTVSVKIYVDKMEGQEYEVSEGEQITISYDFDA